MPVTDLHPQQKEFSAYYKTMRDVVKGEPCIKGTKNRETYLPKLTSHIEDVHGEKEYDDYVGRADFFAATERTVEGLVGTVMRKDPQIIDEGKDIKDEFWDDVTLEGDPFRVWVEGVLKEEVEINRSGLWVDFNEEEQRPYVTVYEAEDIWNLKVSRINGVLKLSLVVLRENYPVEDQDEFEHKTKPQLRVLKLVPEMIAGGEELVPSGDYIYQVFIYRKDIDGKWVVAEDAEPAINGQPLDYIPFHVNKKYQMPKLYALAKMNISHYRSSAELENLRHFAGHPLLWGFGEFGDDPADGEENPEVRDTVRIGSKTAWIASSENANLEYATPGEDGANVLTQAMKDKREMMGALGAELLEERPDVQETATAVKMRQSGKISVLQRMALTVGLKITMALRDCARWYGVANPKVSCVLNTDFFDEPLAPDQLEKLVELWQTGFFSYDTCYHIATRGEATRPGITAENERDEIERNPPPLLPPTNPFADDE